MAAVGEPFGASFASWNVLSGYEALHDAIKNACDLAEVSEERAHKMLIACDDLERAIVSVRDEGRGIGFVDCGLANDTTSLIFDAESEVSNFKSKLKRMEYTISVDAFRRLSEYCLWIVGDLRTPWRYTLDIARNELLEKYVERNGASMGF